MGEPQLNLTSWNDTEIQMKLKDFYVHLLETMDTECTCLLFVNTESGSRNCVKKKNLLDYDFLQKKKRESRVAINSSVLHRSFTRSKLLTQIFFFNLHFHFLMRFWKHYSRGLSPRAEPYAIAEGYRFIPTAPASVSLDIRCMESRPGDHTIALRGTNILLVSL